MVGADIVIAAAQKALLTHKVLRVIQSCKTEQQFSSALNYVKLSRLSYEQYYSKIVHAAVRDKRAELNLINRSTTCTII